MSSITFGILTISDRCANAEAIDESGPALCAAVQSHLPTSIILHTACVADDFEGIKSILIDWCNGGACNVILTTGGTGFAPRDVTPEATRAIVDKFAPAISEHISRMSVQITPHALISRAVCGIRDRTIILNLPGSRKAAVECFGFVASILTHAVDLVIDRKKKVEKEHMKIQNIDGSKVKVPCAALRSRHSPYPMVPVDDALKMIADQVDAFKGTRIETIAIEKSLGRVLAQDVHSGTPLPPFPASIKDGYAVIAADGAGVRRVREAIVAGDSPTSFILQAGDIVRISTGAPVPNGADAVVQVEDTELVEASADQTKEVQVRILIVPSVGLDIRPIGSDIPANEKILNKHDRITPGHIGVMAAIGITKVQVYTRFKIGIISSGNELQHHAEQLQAGRIFDSNKLSLLNLLRQYGYEATDCGIARDDPNDLKRQMQKAFDAQHDMLITSGGVSMGEYDLVKQVLAQDFDAQIHFGRVDMKPGKPTTFATTGRGRIVFGLPGNPVSAAVTCVLFVLPALFRRERRVDNIHIQVVLDVDVDLDPRPEYMRAQIRAGDDGRVYAQPTGNQISSRLNSFVGADALIILPKKDATRFKLKAGSTVEAIQLGRNW